jgi:DNA-binding beta-propeller fold protein YncE
MPPGVPFTGQLLISDRGNDRLLMIHPDGSVAWIFPAAGTSLPVPFGAPDDAFVTPDGSTVVANAEGSQTVTAINRASGTVLWQVGHNGVRGSTTGYFSEPDDAVPYPDGTIWVADIRNCRLVNLSDAGVWLGTRGSGACRHDPPIAYDEPNGAFPAPNGSTVVTEIGGSWVTWLKPDGTVQWSTRSPAAYPSDALPFPDGSVLLTDYSSPGAIYQINSAGAVLWKYRPTGAAGLDHPSIAIPLASNRIAICDDWDSRIVVIDPTTNTVVWTFTGQGATGLSYPDGLDYLPAG